MAEANYDSGDEFVVEFLGYRFSFNALDFEQRVNGAAVKLGLVEPGELDPDETADLVELTAHGVIAEPQSELGAFLARAPVPSLETNRARSSSVVPRELSLAREGDRMKRLVVIATIALGLAL